MTHHAANRKLRAEAARLVKLVCPRLVDAVRAFPRAIAAAVHPTGRQVSAFNICLRKFAQELALHRAHAHSAHGATRSVRHQELPLGARHAHKAETSLFFNIFITFARTHVWQQTFFTADHGDHLKLKTLGRMQRHQGHRSRVGVIRIGISHQRHGLQEPLQRAQQCWRRAGRVIR